MTEANARIAELYYKSNAVQFGAFRLSVHKDRPDLPLSPMYLHYPKPHEPGSEYLPELYVRIGQAFFELCQTNAVIPRRIAAVPAGALPLADAHARHYSSYPNNVVTFTKEELPGATQFHGPYGSYEAGDELVIDDDHTSGGRNKRLIRATAESGGLVVHTMLTVVDRQQGGTASLAQEGVRLLAIFTIDELLQYGADAGYATQTQVDDAIAYRINNQF